jgi:hypothetical protein
MRIAMVLGGLIILLIILSYYLFSRIKIFDDSN